MSCESPTELKIHVPFIDKDVKVRLASVMKETLPGFGPRNTFTIYVVYGNEALVTKIVPMPPSSETLTKEVALMAVQTLIDDANDYYDNSFESFSDQFCPNCSKKKAREMWDHSKHTHDMLVRLFDIDGIDLPLISMDLEAAIEQC